MADNTPVGPAVGCTTAVVQDHQIAVLAAAWRDPARTDPCEASEDLGAPEPLAWVYQADLAPWVAVPCSSVHLGSEQLPL